MSKPSRPSLPDNKFGVSRTFFVTTRTAGGRPLLQTEKMAVLFINVLRSYMKAGRFTVHDFVVMPNHIHLLITVPRDATIEQAMHLIKGNFSFRAHRDLGFSSEIWQRGFSDVQIRDEQSFVEHRAYIEMNPVQAALSSSPEMCPFGTAYLKKMKCSGAQAPQNALMIGTTEVVP